MSAYTSLVPSLITDKTLMYRAFEGSYANLEFRYGCDFVPFNVSELAEIATTDQIAGRQWTPPILMHHDLTELCDQFKEELEESEAM